MAEHWHEVVVLQNGPLDLLGQLLAFGGIIRFQVLVELGVEFLHTEAILGEESPAFEIRLIPIGPACPDASAVENDLEPGPLLQPTLLPLEENAPLHHLEFGPDTDILKLCDDALATRVVGWRRGEPVDVEAVG